MYRQYSTEHIITLLNTSQIYRMFLRQVFEAKLASSLIRGSRTVMNVMRVGSDEILIQLFDLTLSSQEEHSLTRKKHCHSFILTFKRNLWQLIIAEQNINIKKDPACLYLFSASWFGLLL